MNKEMITANTNSAMAENMSHGNLQEKTETSPVQLELTQNKPNVKLVGNTAQGLTPDKALEQLMMDPVTFIQSLIQQSASQYLADLKEEAELNGALRVLRKQHPEFVRFEPFIMQEVAELIKTDEDGVIEPWLTLLEKGLESFKTKFKEIVKQELSTDKDNPVEPVQMEPVTNRVVPEESPTFTREQIAKMSMAEFLKHEKAINEALTNKRIR